MKKIILFIVLMSGIMRPDARAQNVHIPDFYFKQALLDYYPPIDKNKDGVIQVQEAEDVYTLEINSKGISDLTGISAFKNLKTFKCNNNAISNLNPDSLKDLRILDVSNNNLSSLAVDKLINLNTLDCSKNKLTSLVLNNLPYLDFLICSDNKLTSFDYSSLPRLSELNCANNQISYLYMVGMHLSSLDCSNNKLTSMIFGGNASTQKLYCQNNKLFTINFGNNDGFKEIYCSSNLMVTFPGKDMPDLEILDCSDNDLSIIRMESMPELKQLKCSFNNLTEIEVNTDTHPLEELFCEHNLINAIAFNKFKSLKMANCGYNALTECSLTDLGSLGALLLNNNQLTLCYLENLSSLADLNLGFNLLRNNTLQLNELPKLNLLAINDNQFSDLTMQHLSGLKSLDCSNNQIGVINFDQTMALSLIKAANNKMAELPDLSRTPLLQHLDMSFNLLQKVDIEGLNELSSLLADNNQIASFRLHNLPSLLSVFCEDNPATYFDFKDGANNNSIFLANGKIDDYKVVCRDDDDYIYLVNSNNTVNSSYCGYSPQGDYNVVKGTLTVDANSSGTCTAADPKLSFYNVHITDNKGNQGTLQTDGLGQYEINAPADTVWITVDTIAYIAFPAASQSAGFNGYGNTQVIDFCFKERHVSASDPVENNPLIYPNPTTGVINIKSRESILSIEINDPTGRIILSRTGNIQNAVNLGSNLTPGVYIAKIRTATGTSVEKLILQD